MATNSLTKPYECTTLLFSSKEDPADSEDGNSAILLCSFCLTREASPYLSCTDPFQAHHFCQTCFKFYVFQACVPGGIFEKNISTPLYNCRAGDLPCPLWQDMGDSCSCTSLGHNLIQVLEKDTEDKEALEAVLFFHQAGTRVIQQRLHRAAIPIEEIIWPDVVPKKDVAGADHERLDEMTTVESKSFAKANNIPDGKHDTDKNLPVHCSLCQVDEVIADLSCGNPEGAHVFCLECFNEYATKHCREGGMLHQELPMNGQICPAGVLPCPMWLYNLCQCADFQKSLCSFLEKRNQRDIERFIPEIAQLEKIGICKERNRDIKSASTSETKFADSSMTESGLCETLPTQTTEPGASEYSLHRKLEGSESVEMSTNKLHSAEMECLVRTVEEALSLGLQTSCPRCGVWTVKDSGCMHMRCPTESCRCRWCYCCGRVRKGGGGTFCETCDVQSLNNKNSSNVSWGVAGCSDENEFHRQKTLYFLRQVKDNVDPALWASFMKMHGYLLQNLSCEGICLSWADIDKAELPLYGRTLPAQVLWKSDMDKAIDRLRQHVSAKEYDEITPSSESPEIDESHCVTSSRRVEADILREYQFVFDGTMHYVPVRRGMSRKKRNEIALKVVFFVAACSFVVGSLRRRR